MQSNQINNNYHADRLNLWHDFSDAGILEFSQFSSKGETVLTTRTHQQYILMAISFGGAIAILPFAIYRILQQDWHIALVDLFLIATVTLTGSYVYFKRQIGQAASILSVLALIGVTGVIYLKGAPTIYWAYPTMLALYFIVPPRTAAFLCLLTTLAMIVVLYPILEFAVLMAVVVSLTVNNLFAYVFANRMYHQHHSLTMMTRRDPLTNACNRRAFDEKIKDVILSARTNSDSACLIVIDIDHFKSINDNFGHAVGDTALVNLVKLISKYIRKTDFIFRLGGEEFAILAPGANLQTIRNLAEKLRSKIETSELIAERKLTISLGVAEYRQDETAKHWLERADSALYAAKHHGRNCVEYAAVTDAD